VKSEVYNKSNRKEYNKWQMVNHLGKMIRQPFEKQLFYLMRGIGEINNENFI